MSLITVFKFHPLALPLQSVPSTHCRLHSFLNYFADYSQVNASHRNLLNVVFLVLGTELILDIVIRLITMWMDNMWGMPDQMLQNVT